MASFKIRNSLRKTESAVQKEQYLLYLYRLYIVLVHCIWMFPKIGGTPPKWMVYSGKPYFLMDDLGVPLFLETPIYIYIHMYIYIYRYTYGVQTVGL